MKTKHPYDYRSVPLTSVKGSATFTGEPSKELLEAVNKMAELAFKKITTNKPKIMNENEKELIKEEAKKHVGLLEHGSLFADKAVAAFELIAFCRGAEYGYNLAKATEPRWVKASEQVPNTTYPVYVRFDGFKDVAYFENNKWLSVDNDAPLYPAFTRNIEWLYEPETT